MPESLKDRVGRVIAGTFHSLLDRIEDQMPEAAMEQAIREAELVVDDVRHDLGQVAANRHLAQAQHASLNGEHSKLGAQVGAALTQSREDLMRTAVERQLDIEAQLPVLETTLADLARREGELQGYLAALLAKKREMETALAEFRRTRAAQGLAAVPGSAARAPADRMDAATGAFDRIHERQTGLTATARGATLQQSSHLQELDRMERENKIAERIARLKAGQA
jgi:phage shock protein A